MRKVTDLCNGVLRWLWKALGISFFTTALNTKGHARS